MKRLFCGIALSILSIFISGVAFAEPMRNPPLDNPRGIDSEEIVAEMLSTSKMSEEVQNEHNIEFMLRDGTRIGGLLFLDPSKGVRPLILGDFGLASSRASPLGSRMVEKLFYPGLLHANLLILDNVSGAQFYKENHSLGFGGYDSGRILVEVAEQVKKYGIPFTSLHVLGASLGGQTAIQAILEDQRLGTRFFQSAITFCGVVDEAKSTAAVMQAVGQPLRGIQAPGLPVVGNFFLRSVIFGFNMTSQKIGAGLPWIFAWDAGKSFYRYFQDRLRTLAGMADWNPSVSRDTVEDYITTSSDLVNQVSALKVPLFVVHAKNDPLVDFDQFAVFAKAQEHNPYVQTLGMSKGSHCGFPGAYGDEWVANLINRSVEAR